MSASKHFLNAKQGNHVLKWITEHLSSPQEVRHVRMTFGLENSGLKLQIKLPPPSAFGSQQWESLSKTMTTYPGLVNEKKGYTKTDFSPEESKQMFKDLLSSTWISTGDGVNKSGFIRPASQLQDEKVIVEYGSPNIAKPMHMGHLRSLVTGHFVAKICKAAGHDTKTICFLGDWGTQFGILQAGLAKFLPQQDQKEDVLKSVENLTLDELLRYYVQSVKENEINETFSKEALRLSAALEEGNKEALEVWKSVREKTINHLKKFWELFGIRYDTIQGESEFTVQSKTTEKALKGMTELGIVEIGGDNCTYVVLQPDQKFATAMKIPVVKKDGSSLYLLRDVSCAIGRQEMFKYDRMFYIVDKTQSQHFITLFRILEGLKIQHNQYASDSWSKRLHHVIFGKVEGMSTRSGNFVLLSEVISEGSSFMQENRSKSPNARNVDDSSVATQLAISALIVNSLKVRRQKDVQFDWNEALRPIGETGVNLQYTHARLSSLEKNAKESISMNVDEIEMNFDYLLNDPVALNLAVHLTNFEDAFWSSYGELEPCVLLAYLFKLSDKVSKALKHLKVISEEDKEIAKTRLLLFALSRRVLATGMNTLGIKPLDEI